MWENIQIKKGKGGCGDVTVEQKNDLSSTPYPLGKAWALLTTRSPSASPSWDWNWGSDPHAEEHEAENSRIEYGYGQFTNENVERGR